MIATVLLAGALFLAAPATSLTAANEEALKAVQELYDYSTRAVEVDPAKVQQMVAKIEAQLDSPRGDVAQAYQQLRSEAEKDQPHGRDLRVYASTLYSALLGEAASANST